MRLSPLNFAAMFGLLGATSALQIVAYNNVDDCNADSNTVYRVFSGIQQNICYEFETTKDAWDIPCKQFNQGGIENSDCNLDAIFPTSALVESGDGAYCTVWTEKGCVGSYGDSRGYTEPRCVNPRFDDGYKSFSCGPQG